MNNTAVPISLNQQCPLKGIPRIACLFDEHQNSPQSILYSSSTRNMLVKLLPKDFFFLDEASEELALKFNRLLPIFKWLKEDQNSYLSIFLLCRHRANGVKFFYEMISRWLLPGKRPNICSFFATDFKFPDLLCETFTICEVIISLDSSHDDEFIRHQLSILESEIRLGLV